MNMQPREPNWTRLLQADGQAFWIAKSDHGTLWYQPRSWSNRAFTAPVLAEAFVKPPNLVELEGPWKMFLTSDGRAFWRQETETGTSHYQPSDWARKTFTDVNQIDSFEKGHEHMPATSVSPQNFGVLLSNVWQNGVERISGTAAQQDPTGGVTLSQPAQTQTQSSTEQCPIPPEPSTPSFGGVSPWLAGSIVIAGILIFASMMARKHD